MGRTIPSFRIAGVMEEMEWRRFRNSLDDEVRMFDKENANIVMNYFHRRINIQSNTMMMQLTVTHSIAVFLGHYRSSSL
jgi:hypothetical protein